MKKAYKLIGTFFRTLPSGEEKFYEHGSELDDLTEAEVLSLGNKLTLLEGKVEPSDLRSGIDPEPEDDEQELDPSPVEEVMPETEAEESEVEESDDGESEDDEDDDQDDDSDDDSNGSEDDDSDDEQDDDDDDDDEQDEQDDEDDTPEKAAHVGGGWYLLPNGDKVKGKDSIPEQWR